MSSRSRSSIASGATCQRARARRRAACFAALAAAVLAGGCSYRCEDKAHGPWSVTYVNSAEAAAAARARFTAAPPSCEAAVKSAAETAAQTPGTVVDPDLLEIARLEVERDCYKKAEENLRNRVQAVKSVTPD